MTEEKKFSFSLTAAQLDVIAAGLGEVALKISAPVLTELQRQFAEQSKPEPSALPEKPAKK